MNNSIDAKAPHLTSCSHSCKAQSVESLDKAIENTIQIASQELLPAREAALDATGVCLNASQASLPTSWSAPCSPRELEGENCLRKRGYSLPVKKNREESSQESVEFSAARKVELRSALVYYYKFLMSQTSKVDDSSPIFIFDEVYATIMEALDRGINYIFDEAGHLLSMQSFEKLAAIKLGQSHFPKCCELIKKKVAAQQLNETLFSHHELEEEVILRLSKLSLPHTFRHLKGNELLILRLLQRLYPVRKFEDSDIPILSSTAFLYAYKNYVSTACLFQLIAICLKLDERYMPHEQKMRVLHLCRTWFEGNIASEEKNLMSVKRAFFKIIKACDHLQKLPTSCALTMQKRKELVDFCDELMIIFNAKNIGFKFFLGEGEIDVASTVEKIISGKCEKRKFEEFIEAVSYDLKISCALLLNEVSPLDIAYQRNTDNELSKSYDRLIRYVKYNFYKIKEQQLTGVKIADFINNFFYLFTSLGVALININEYFNSFAIYNALIIPEILQEMPHIRKSKEDWSLLKHKNALPDSLAELQIVKTQENFKKMKNLFSPYNNFENYQKEIKRCQFNGLFYLPHIAFIYQKTVMDTEKITLIEQHSIHDSIEKERLKLYYNQSLLFSWILSTLQEVRFHIKNETKDIRRHTNIGYNLLKEV